MKCKQTIDNECKQAAEMKCKLIVDNECKQTINKTKQISNN